jgi:hypothetical protein
MHLPLILKITAIAVVLLLVLLVIAVRRKQRTLAWTLIVMLLLGIGFGAWKGLSEYNRTNEDLSNVKAEISISAMELISQYEANDSVANVKYLGRIIEIEGNVKRTEPDEKGIFTVIVGDTSSLSSVRCAMDTIHNQDAAHLVAGSSIKMRGACTGFMRDDMGLGSDVILNRCVVIEKND